MIKGKNLDGLRPDELDKEALRHDAPEAYRRYATLKAVAMRARRNNSNIETYVTVRIENQCDKWYKEIPENWRW